MVRRVVAMAALAAGMMLAGCSSEIPPPDAPIAADGALDAAPPPPAPGEIALLLPDPSVGPAEMEDWAKTFWTEGRHAKVVVTVDRLPRLALDQPGRQAQAIRNAARRSATLLLLAGPGIQPALDEAAGLGTRMIALEEPLTAGGKPLPLVTYPPIEETARELVEAAIAASTAAGFPPNGPAIVLHRDAKDRRLDSRADAIEAALKAAKVDVLPRLLFDGAAIEAKKALLPLLEKQPRLAMAFTTEEVGLPALIEQRREKITTDRFVIAGFTADRKDMLNVSFGQVAALVFLDPSEAIPVAFRLARDLAAGKSIAARTIIPRPVSRAKGDDMTDRLPKPPVIPDVRAVAVPRFEKFPPPSSRRAQSAQEKSEEAPK